MVRLQKSVHQIVLEMRGNKKNLGVNIIRGYPIFETFRKTHGVCKFDMTLEWAKYASSNGMPATILITYTENINLI